MTDSQKQSGQQMDEAITEYIKWLEQEDKGCHEKRYGEEYFRQHFADIKYRRLYSVDKI